MPVETLIGAAAGTRGRRAAAPPAWRRELEAAYAGDAPCPAALATAQPVTGFLNLVRPLTARARHRLGNQLRALSRTPGAPPFDPAALEEQLIAPLGERLLWMVSRTLALELQVAALRGELAGDTAAERFAAFTERLREPAQARVLFAEYPVLARELVEAVERWRAVSAELIARLVADWPRIRACVFAGRDPGPLVAVDGGAGDAHRGGRSVRILTFASGARLVYKPRSLAVDRHLQDLLAWCNARGQDPAFRLLAVLDRGSHGWTEFAAAEPCADAEAVARFYGRLGAQLALLYALEATDFHQENLIAAGEHPVLPDVEALFQPRVGGLDLRRADQVAWAAINHSVLRVGLLPQWQGDADAQIDISGLGSTDGALTPYAVPRWENEGTDAMRLARRRVVMDGSDNRPAVAGAPADPAEHAGALVDGFTVMYRRLVEHREELLAPGGPLARFAGDEVRMLLRPTRTYATLQRESFHPDVLRDAGDRERLLDRLSLAVESCPPLAAAVPSERAELLRGDIPLFTTTPTSRDLHGGDGRVLTGFFDETGMDQVRRRIARLSEDDLAQQTWFIQASVSTVAQTRRQAGRSGRALPARPAPATPERLIDAARAVGDRIGALALRGDGDVSWVGLSIAGAQRWSLTPLGADLYDGLPGVALFLAQLGALTGERRHTELARAAVTTLRRQVDLVTPASAGAFDGLGGVVYALTHLGALWSDGALLAGACEIAGRMLPLIARDESFDVVSGSAGAAAALLCLHDVLGEPTLLTAAELAGDRLLAGATELPGGLGWGRDSAGGEALSGFSHGAAGIAWALLRLGNERFVAAARRAIGFERTLFSAAHGNWRDLRPQVAGEAHFQTSWCHGAVGIGLARLTAPDRLDAGAEIETALQTTLTHGLSESHALCHGSLGNLELLLEASRRLDAQRWRPHVDRWAALILHDIERHGWYCGTSQGIESPGLMTGLAGIGYGLLRVADPDSVPSVLTLEPPRA